MTMRIMFFVLGFAYVSQAKIVLNPISPPGVHFPVFATSAPRDKQQLFLVEQQGRILVLKNGLVQRSAFLDIRNKVRSGGEMGLLSVAFHPEFGKKGSKNQNRYFVNYTARKPKLSTVVAEYEVGKSTEKVLLRIDQPYSNHNGGQIAFDKKGKLFIGMGDGGAGGDPRNYSQNLNSLLGKMLRIDVDKGKAYGIPADNPFASGTGGRKEIYAWGLRNPWRFSFDRVTGDLFAADVGQYKWEEVHIVERGKNYGWRLMEGNHCFDPDKNCKKGKRLELPIHEYPRQDGQSITGGYVYRGKKIPSLAGSYVFGDYESGKIWGLKKQGSKWKRALLIETERPISSFGEDADGEILVVFHQNRTKRNIYRLSFSGKKG